MSVFARELADALLLYSAGLNMTMGANARVFSQSVASADLRLGDEIVRSLHNFNLTGARAARRRPSQWPVLGFSGNISIDRNAVRVSFLSLTGLTANFSRIVHFNAAANSTQTMVSKRAARWPTLVARRLQSLEPLFTDEATVLWATRGGVRPLSVPLCGFDGSGCVPSFWAQYGAIIYAAGGVLLLLVLLTLAFLIR